MEQYVGVVVREVDGQRRRDLDRHFVEQSSLLVIRQAHEEIGCGTGADPLELFKERRPLSAGQQVSKFLQLLAIHHGTQEPTTFSRRLRRAAADVSCARITEL